MNRNMTSQAVNSLRDIPALPPLPSAFKTPRGEALYLTAYDDAMQRWPVEYETLDARSRFGATHVVACGSRDAPPMVLLHCFGTSLTAWARNVADLSRHYRVYALDMMGQPGRSIPDQPIRTRDEMVEWMTGILDDLDIHHAILIGYSYGGFAALNYAMRVPDRVNRLVLLSPAGGLVPLKAEFYIRGALSTMLSRFSELTTNVLWFNWFCYAPNMKDADTRRMFDSLSRQFALGVKHFRMQPTVLPRAYADDELRSIRQPTLLLIGRQESLYDPVSAIKRGKQLIPDLQAELIPGASHDLPVSKPQIVNPRVLEFAGRAN
jgi:pimeloyl-ACP methyl ester carboxylesterase